MSTTTVLVLWRQTKIHRVNQLSGIYTTQEKLEEARKKITNWKTSVETAELDGEPK